MSLKQFLKEKKFVTSLPVVVKFKRKSGGTAKFPAKKGTEVMKYSDVLKALRIQKAEIKNKIRTWDDFKMANILEEDLDTL